MKDDLTQADRESARQVVAALRPDEGPLLEDLLAPPRRFQRRRSSSLGYGIDVSVDVIAPYVVLLVVWVKSIVQDEAADVVEGKLRRVVRRVLHADPKEVSPPTPPVGANVDANQLKLMVVEYASRLGADETASRMLADAIVDNVTRQQGAANGG